MAGTKFDEKRFARFLDVLTVDTKDAGTIRLGRQLLGTQKEFYRQIIKGMESGRYETWCLKGRQVAITTAMLALDLYWAFSHPGIKCTLIADDESNSTMFRETLNIYHKGLPPEAMIPIRKGMNNRYGIGFVNRSSIIYQIAGRKRGNVRLGQGKGITFAHGTEVAFWGSEEGLASLQSSLAQKNPNRLFVFESTANGYNMFQESYKSAQASKVAQGIFIGWWLNENFSISRKDPRFKQYWDGKYTGEEMEWVRDVNKLYKIELRAEQIVWWRWMKAEKVPDDQTMYQENPPTEEYAFVMTGTNYFSNTRVTDEYKRAREINPDYWRFDFGMEFQDTRLLASNEKMADLLIWEEPRNDAHYVIGADPAYGSSEWADRFCISVYRCYANGMDQVAEFCTTDLNTFQFAWILCYLAGIYRNCTLNLEVNGPGQAVLNEIRNLKRQAAILSGDAARDMLDVLGGMRQYLWRKHDNLNGPGNNIGWITTSDSKARMFGYLKDGFERKMIQINSLECLDEMKNIVNDDGYISAFGRNKDDRVLATTLATAAWADQVQPQLIGIGVTRENSHHGEDPVKPEPHPASRTVQNYLDYIGFQR